MIHLLGLSIWKCSWVVISKRTVITYLYFEERILKTVAILPITSLNSEDTHYPMAVIHPKGDTRTSNIPYCTFK